jgi:hypothetical protein
MNSDELQTLSIAPETHLGQYGLRWERAAVKLSELQHDSTKVMSRWQRGAAVGSVDVCENLAGIDHRYAEHRIRRTSIVGICGFVAAGRERNQDSDLIRSWDGDFGLPLGFCGSKPAALMMARPMSSGEKTNSAAGAGLLTSSSGLGVTKR